MQIDEATLRSRFQRMSDSELKDTKPEELTESGRQALAAERLRRTQPDYQAEKNQQERSYAAHAKSLAVSRAKSTELSAKARKYAWLVTIFLGLPLLMFLTIQFEQPAGMVGRNQRILDKQMQDLPQSDARQVQRYREGAELSRRVVDHAFTFGGGSVLVWGLSFLVSRLALSII